MLKKITLILLVMSFVQAFAAEVSSAAFLHQARHPLSSGTYAKLSGVVQHRRRGAKVESFPIYFGVIIQQERFSGQLILDDRDSLLIGQSRKDGTSAVTPLAGNVERLNRIGLRATDLTLGFIHGKFLKELPKTTLGLAACRVMMLAGESGEEVKVYFAEEAAFPLKAEFFRKGEKTPFRTLESNGFTRKNDLYYARELNLEGPGWRTRVEFDPDSAELGPFDPKNPVNVIRSAGKKK